MENMAIKNIKITRKTTILKGNQNYLMSKLKYIIQKSTDGFYEEMF